MKSIQYCCLLIFLIPVALFSQSNSYYIDLNDRKIYGEVIVESAYDDARILRFKSLDEGKRISLNATDIKAYVLDGKRYFFSRQNPNSEKKDIVFWESMVHGEISLHRFKEKYFLEFGNRWEQLYIREVKEQIDGKQYSGKTNEHIKILAAAFSDCEELKREIVSGERVIVLNERRLYKLMRDYHVCANEEYTFFNTPTLLDKTLPTFRVGVGLYAGIGFANPKINANLLPVFPADFDLSGDAGLNLGVSAELYFPRISSRWALVVSPYFQQNSFSGFAQGEQDTLSVRRDIQGQFNEISIPYGLKFIFRPSWNNAYISFGYSHHIYSGQEYLVRRESRNLNTEEIEITEGELRQLKNSGQGSWFSLGFNAIQKEKIQIPLQIRFMRNREFIGVEPTGDPNTTIKENNFASMQILVGLMF